MCLSISHLSKITCKYSSVFFFNMILVIFHIFSIRNSDNFALHSNKKVT